MPDYEFCNRGFLYSILGNGCRKTGAFSGGRHQRCTRFKANQQLSITPPPMARFLPPRSAFAGLALISSLFILRSLWPLLSEKYSTMTYTPNNRPNVKSLTFTYKSVDGHSISVDVYPPTLVPGHRTVPKVPAVVYFHGGGLAVGDRASWFPSWLQSAWLAPILQQ